MLARSKTRVISILLSLVMVISAMPIQAFAAEPEAHDHDHAVEPIIVEELETAAPEEESATDSEETPVDDEETTEVGDGTPAEGDDTTTEGDGAPAEGDDTTTEGDGAPTEGDDTTTEGDGAPAEGDDMTTEGDGAPTEGDDTTAEGDGAPAEGDDVIPEGDGAPAEGDDVIPEGEGAPVEGEEIPEETVPEEELPGEEIPEEILQEELVQEIEVSEAYQDIQDQIDDLLMAYLGSTELTRDEIEDIVVNEMDGGMILEAQWEIMCIEEEAMEALTEDELELLVDSNPVLCDFIEVLAEYAEPISVFAATSGTHAPVTGVTVSVTNATDNSMTDGAITVTAKGSGGFFGIGASAKTATITIQNSGNGAATLSFDWVRTDVNDLQIDGTQMANNSGAFSKLMEAGASITVVMTTAKNDTTNTLVLDNFGLVAAAATSNVTFEYDNALGSVTVNDIVVESDTIQAISLAGATLAATPNSGYIFVGWLDGNGHVLSKDTPYTLTPAADMTVKAVFAQNLSSGPFAVGAMYFNDLNAAGVLSAATLTPIVLTQDYELPSGEYIIPVGATLLIPFDAANTLYTTVPESVMGTFVTPKAYRTLTMASGANLTINGAVSLSAKHFAAGGGERSGGTPYESYSHVVMNSNSTITVNKGGALYVYGYITGNGVVLAKDGSTVYENFQVEDFRGGTATSKVAVTNESKRVFPLSQYYVQNIEVPLTLESGAKEYSYTSIEMKLLTANAYGSSVAFIGKSGAMFNLTSGSVTKWYDKATDRLMIEANGDMKISPLAMSIGSTDINSTDFELPINGNITVEVNQGSISLAQNVALLPGAEIIVGEGVTCVLGAGNSMFVYDLDDWGGYTTSSSKKLCPLNFAPNRTYTRTEADLKDAEIVVKGTVSASAGYVYTTAGGASITGVEGAKATLLTGSQTTTNQYDQAGDTFVGIAITPAKLKNADGTYVQSGTNTYTYTSGKWRCKEHTYTEEQKAATCGEAGYTKYTCSVCGHSYMDTVPATGEHSDTNTDYKCDICGISLSCDDHTAGIPVPENVKAPTCTATGSHDSVTYCSKCGQEMSRETVIDAMIPHAEVVIPAVEATCTTTGLTEGKKCSACGLVTVEQETTALADHTEVTIPAVAPTCEGTGLTEGAKCSVCGEILTAQQLVPAAGHQDEPTFTEATCTEPEWIINVCTVCGREDNKVQGEPALGHKETTIAGKAPTCTATGLTDGVKCSVCGEILTEQTEIPMIAHAYDDGVVSTTPTCGAAGVKTFTCGVCGDTYTEAIEATAHTEEALPAVAPDCETTGLTEGKKCSVCDAILVAQEVVPALGHTEETVAGKAPTCTETGLTEGKKCSVCGKTLAEQETIDALGHSYTGEVTTAPGCETTGVKTFTCGVCGDSYTEEIAATDHDWDEGVVTTAPGCETTGVKTYTCQNDNAHTYTVEIAATGHDWDEGVVTKEASCGVEGVKTYTCGNCGETKTEKIDALSHDPQRVIVAATCETAGSDNRVCKNCGLVVSETVIPALGHSHVGVETTAPTCTKVGVKTYTCSTCGDTYTEEIAALGHTEETIPAVDATCEATGLTAGVKCSVCGEILAAQEVVPALGHKEETIAGKAATCEEPGLTDGVKCSACGKTLVAQEEIAALGHTEETVAGKAATCESTGLTDGVKCSVCGKTLVEQEEIAALGHSWGEGEVTTVPGCESAGVKTYTCSTCGETKTEAVSATGHTEETIPAVDATCETAGKTAGVKCSVCGAVIKTQEEIPALGHDWDNGVETVAPGCETAGVKTYTCSACDATKTEEIAAKGHTEETIPGKDATCEDTGLTSGVKCSVCDAVIKAQEEIPALGHKEETIAGKAATCEETGLTDGVKCSVCGETLVAQEEIDALGHKEEIIAGKAATCEATGLTDGVKCSVCGKTLVEQEEIAALGHKEEIIEGKDATCEETGLTDGVKCSVCGKTLVEQEEIDALGHKEEIIAGKAATCKEPGLTDGVKCSVCDKILTEQSEIPVIPHAYDEGVVTTEPGCVSAGVKTYTCSACGDTYTEEVAAVGHSYDAVVTAPTCTENGYTTHTCSVCGHSYKDSETAATGHTEAEAVVENRVEPGCTTEGSYETVVYCSVCDAEMSRVKTVLDAVGHIDEQGDDNKCDNCGTDMCGEGHSYDEGVVTAPTCEEQGYTMYTCERCGEIEKREHVAALGHSWDNGVVTKDPTCTETGVKTYTCGNCGDTKTESIDAQGHAEEEIPAVEATCESTGLTDGVKCSACGEILTAQEEIPATGHDHDDGVVTKEPTCTEAGVKIFTCACGDTYTEEIAALGHTEEIIEGKDATCEEPGLTDGVKCSACGEILTAQEEIPALDHSYDDGVETTAPTCTEAGEKTFTCAVCGDTKIEALPAAGHSYEEEIVAPTCKEQGYTKHTCSACGDTYQDEWTATVGCQSYDVTRYPATCTTGTYDVYVCPVCGDSFELTVSAPLGHTEETIPAVDATCTEDGLGAGVKCSVCGEILTAPETVPALGHTEETIPAVDATCEETGLSAGVKCSVCGEILSAPETVPALGHTEEEIPAVDATCENTGLGAGVKCSVCGKVLTEQEEIAALGHAYVGEVTTEADCESAGVKTFTCSTCGDSYTEEIAAIGHAWNEGVVSKEATCTETGEKTFVCQNDGSHTKVEEIPVEAHTDSDGNNRCDDCGQSLCDEHQYESVVTNPTCQQGGYTTHTCSACGDSYKDNETPAADHLYTEYTSDNNATCEENGTQSALCDYGCGTKKTVELENSALGHDYISTTVQATCETEGYTIRTCSRCDYERKYKTADAKGHAYDDGVVTTEPGCETTGIKTFTCKNDKGHTYTEVVEATGHTPAEAVRENIQDGNCTAGSSYDSVVYCSACEKELSRKTVTIEATDHTPAEMVVENKVDADCEAAGSYDNVVYCSVCGDEISRETVTVDALGHTAGETVVENKVDADCETAGSYDNVVYCSVCDGEISRETVTVDALGHKWNWGVITTEATCEAEGIKLFTCTVCDGTKEEPVEALGHDLVEYEGKKPTYTDAGWDAYVTCTRCDYTTYVEIPALGEATITSFEEFVENLAILEELTDTYVKKVSPGKDPAGLIIKYIRTGVDRYNSGSWNIMAGYEDADFAKFITEYENDYNANLSEGQELLAVTGLKNIDPFYLPNGDFADIGHVFGTMDITYTNKSSVNHADVAGWGGDLVDLLSLSDQFGVEATELEALVAEVTQKYFLRFEEEFPEKPNEGTFSLTDVYGDLDGFHIMQELYAQEYENGVLTELFTGYLTEELTAKDRAEYFLANRLGGVSLRGDVRDAVYNTYLGNSVIATLEGTREFKAENLNDLRKAVCYAFADYICKLGGDYVQSTDNPYLTVFQSTTSTLAPGITQKINYATTADDQTMVYYIATGDITRDDVHVYANYNNNDPGAGWAMQRVLDQANAAQAKYGDPASEQYIENYNVIVSTNGDGYNMHTGEPGGLLVMDGYEWHPCDGSGFFAILADGTARIGTLADYKELKAQGLVKEAIGAFGTTLVSEGKINVTATGNYFTDRASRTAVGITATGKVVMLVIDGRQGEFSCGASAIEIAQIMLDAGCYTAVNLDGGGSSTYVARPEGEDALRVVSSPSDGAARSVSTSLLMVSTAPSSTAFDHAVLNSDHTYLAAGATTQVTAKAVSATGNVVDMPEGTTWAVSDETLGAIDESGVFTASANGQVDVNLMLGEEIIGSKTLYVVTPDNVYFDKDNINAIYGHVVELPVKAVYEGKNVAITESDVVLSLGNPTAGIIDGFTFTGIEESGLKKVTVNAALAADTSVTASMLITLYSEDEASFDFDNATGGDRQLAWDREVSNSTQQSADVYRVVDPAEPMSTTYTFAIDMSKIEIPDKLADLTYMLPGADMENASAWNFLLQLAERVSVLTEVRPVLRFDPNFELDYSEMTVANEYFLLGEDGVEFDEENNALTLVLKWKDQENPIDADTANPLCILSGIKLTPKEDAQWDAKNQLKAVNTGEISYEIYLRANALYSFAQKPENQEIYGLKPFENKDFLIGGSTEKGASFGDIYKTFEDSYTLVNAVKDGWVIEDGGFAYYKDGERLTGICEVDGLYYDFGDDGINAGQTPYTGVMVDEEGNEYYLVNGTKYCGWWTVDQKDIRYYNEETGIRESLIADETPSTCIIDGHCIYTTESGLVKRIDYDDAGGHDYVEQADGSYVCALCGYVRIEMPDVDVTLSYYECTYTGAARTPSTTAVAKDGRVLTKPGQSDYPDYSSTYKDNVEVGTASVTLKAARYGKYSNLQTWRGNAAGEITVTYEIRPDVPANVEMTANGDVAVMTWDAAKAPGVTYVIYRTADGSEWEEFATTEETTYSVDLADCDGCMFRIGTRKIVDGKAYESLTFTKNVSAGIVVMADNNEEGKPTLKWSAVSGAESYQVYRATRQNGTYSKVFTTAGNSYTHASATEGTTYYYKVKAVLSDGTAVTSEIVTATCKAPEVEIEITTGNNAEGKPTLKWTAVDGAASYQVYRATKENGTYSKVFTTTGTTYTHASAEVGSTYYYKLKVVLESGTEVFTDVVTNTCLAPEEEIVIELVTGNNADGKPTLKWNAIEGAESYAVYRSTTEGGTYAKVFTTAGTTYTHVSATAGKSYFYKLKVTMDDGSEIYSDVVTNTCVIPEAKFVITTGNNAEGKPTLKWNVIEGAASYEVHRSTTENGTYQKVFATTGTTYTHVSATAGRSYYYKLKVILNDGSEEFSQIVTNTCLIPDAMFNITAGHNADGKPTLKWTAIAGAESYDVYRSVEEDGLYQKVFTTAGTTYTHVSATPGNTYYYKLKVTLADGTEETSDIIVNSCLNLNYDFIITTGNNASGKPTMAWEPIVDAKSYEVYRSNTKSGTYNQVFTTTGTTYTHVSAVEGNTYYYKLKVIFNDGSAKTSDIVTNSCLGA